MRPVHDRCAPRIRQADQSMLMSLRAMPTCRTNTQTDHRLRNREVQISRQSIVDIVSARASSEELAYIFLPDGTAASEVRWSFADTARNTRAIAAHLRDRGISAGDRVVLAVNPSLEYIAAL